MPTYVYKFVETGETIEVQQSFTDDTLTEYVHPSTGAPMAVKKVFQPVGVTFKGQGFYKTDSRGGGAKAGSTAGSTTSGDGGSSSSDASTSSSTGDSSGSTSGSSSGSTSASTGTPAAPAATSST